MFDSVVFCPLGQAVLVSRFRPSVLGQAGYGLVNVFVEAHVHDPGDRYAFVDGDEDFVVGIYLSLLSLLNISK